MEISLDAPRSHVDGRPKLAVPWPKLSRAEWRDSCKAVLAACKTDRERMVAVRKLADRDLYFFIIAVLGWTWIDCDWAYALSEYVGRNKWGRLFICAREHYKSTIITIASTVRYMCMHPSAVGVIYSYNVTSAQRLFYIPVKTIFETCKALPELYPEACWTDPIKESDLWSNDAGINLKGHAKGRKECSLEYASILKLKTGSHFDWAIYDDCVTVETVVTPDSIQSCIQAWQQSLNTLARGSRYCMVGTFYHYAELYNHVIEQHILTPVIQPCYDPDGVPVRFTREELEKKRLEMGQGVFASQMLCDPRAASQMGFDASWLRFWKPVMTAGLNVYIIVDPASVLSRKTDYTTMWVIGIDHADNILCIDMIRDKLNLTQRTDAVFDLVRRYKPICTYWESVGNTDVEHILEEMNHKSYHFRLQRYGQWVKKENRIEALMPDFQKGRIWLPEYGTIVRRNWEGQIEDMVKTFVEVEYKAYPVMAHDDAIDCLGNIHHPEIRLDAPDEETEEQKALDALTAKGLTIQPVREEYHPW